jgi:hypothetical protein
LHSETALIGGNETWGLWRPCQSRQKELCWIDPDRSCEPEVPVDIQCQPGDEEAFFPVSCIRIYFIALLMNLVHVLALLVDGVLSIIYILGGLYKGSMPTRKDLSKLPAKPSYCRLPV